MTGVEILNQFEVVIDTAFSWKSFWIGLAIGAVVGLATAFVFGCSEGEWEAFAVGCAIFIPIIGLFCALLGGGVLAKEPVEYETRYEVSINEEVSMQEFMDRYEIVETRGSIYTVREK